MSHLPEDIAHTGFKRGHLMLFIFFL